MIRRNSRTVPHWNTPPGDRRDCHGFPAPFAGNPLAAPSVPGPRSKVPGHPPLKFPAHPDDRGDVGHVHAAELAARRKRFQIDHPARIARRIDVGDVVRDDAQHRRIGLQRRQRTRHDPVETQGVRPEKLCLPRTGSQALCHDARPPQARKSGRKCHPTRQSLPRAADRALRPGAMPPPALPYAESVLRSQRFWSGPCLGQRRNNCGSALWRTSRQSLS